ncbi:hypothetical protein LTR57_006448 [Friedmanniomyces endolithicus]|nr:hypothetical protein LTR35_009838 [Friedmanniomyces endolithicus]KAK0311191.1 hypothetical protein LTR01_003185 [Friedmanniomyces endolithicus]KAK0923789.1 hypothetical protein LTR57_006448 [Friedmanniomyces endolithicus]
MAAINLTAPQYKLVGAVVDTTRASFDWKAIATKMGHADAKKARDAWYSVRDKLTAAVGAEEKKGIDLAPAQKELLGFVIEGMSASIDWETVAGKMGFPTAKKARDSWYPIRNKFTTLGGDGEKASPKKRKAAAEPESEKSGNEAASAKKKKPKRAAAKKTTDVNSGEEAAPAKKTKRTAAKQKTDEDSGEEAAPAKKPKKAAPKKADSKKTAAAAKKGKKSEKAATPEEDGEEAKSEEEIAYDRSDAADAGSEQEGGEMFT